jgi:hypothetical protein
MLPLNEIVKRSTTSHIFHIFITDSASPGNGKTGLAFNTASLTARYINSGDPLSGALTIEDITTIGTYQAPSDNLRIRFKEVSAANMPGVYEVHTHDDWWNLTSTRRAVTFQFKGASGMLPCTVKIQLVDSDAEFISNWANTSDTGFVTPDTIGYNNRNALKPTILGKTLDVSNNGNAGIDWGNIDNPGTVQALTLTTVGTVNSATLNATSINAIINIFTGYKLDKLFANVLNTSDVTVSSAWARMSSRTGIYSSFNFATDSLEAIRDQGDTSWGASGAKDWTDQERAEIRNRLGINGSPNTAITSGVIPSLAVVTRDMWGNTIPTPGVTYPNNSWGNNLASSVIAVKSVVDSNATNIATILGQTGTTGVQVADKTGYKLAADGLNSIPIADPGSPASHDTFPKMVVAIYRALWKKSSLDGPAGLERRYADDGTTVNAKAALTDTPTLQSRDAFVAGP